MNHWFGLQDFRLANTPSPCLIVFYFPFSLLVAAALQMGL
jgi:hypothetical protein